MGRRGPKPQPASIKEAKGNAGRRPIGSDPALPADQTVDGASVAEASSAIEPPDWLKKEGLVVWERHAPRLVAQRLLTATDVAPFARYCRNFARWLKMQRIIDKEGETYESESAHGKLKRAHPAFLIADRIERGLLAIEDRFGINPAERQRIYAARAASGIRPNDLFGGTQQPKPGTTAQTAPSDAEQSKAKSAIGFLN
jgi:P27 family predicted phage terminase small subunit